MTRSQPFNIFTLAWCCIFALNSAFLLADPIDIRLTGNIDVQIEPAEALTDGALWRLDDGAWQEPGLMVDVPAGWHTVTFAPLGRWAEPESVRVLVVGGATSRRSVQYEPLVSYPVGSIPDHNAWHGRSLKFLVEDDPDVGSAASIEFEPQPYGEIAFDGATGLFRFAPALEDRTSFVVRFVDGQGAVLQQVSISPQPHLPPEIDSLETERRFPDPESAEFLVVHDVKSEDVEPFNHADRNTRVVTISGKSVVFDPDSAKNGLYGSLNENDDVKELRVFAETVIIRNALRLPQTKVAIHARELRFEDQPGSGEIARIDTTPRDDQTVPGESENGVGGLKAGDIELAVERLYTSSDAGPRFVLRGGNGQSAGLGRDSVDRVGRPMNVLETFRWCPCFRNPLLLPSLESNCSWSGVNEDGAPKPWGGDVVFVQLFDWRGRPWCTMGEQSWPQDGEDAVPSGRPGSGGDGGDIFATVDIPPFMIDSSGGSAGDKAPDVFGGEPGSPATALWLRARPLTEDELRAGCPYPEGTSTWYGAFRSHGFYAPTCVGLTTELLVFEVFDSRTAAKGQDAVAPDADILVGSAGSFGRLASPKEWFHPSSVRGVLHHVREAYLQGHMDFARETLEVYSALLDAYEASQDGVAVPGELHLIRQEVDNLLGRVVSNLDYFGNPAGWVPMLSFEVTKTAFEREIDSAFKLLYSIYWLEKIAHDQHDRVEALNVTRNGLVEEIGGLEEAYSAATTSLPGLTTRFEGLKDDIFRFEARLQEILEQLVREARNKVKKRHKVPGWKKAASVLSSVAQVVPVGQPVLGAIGTGLDLVLKRTGTEISLQTLREDFKSIKKVEFSKFATDAKDFKDKVKEIKSKDPGNVIADAKAIYEGLNLLAEKFAPVIDSVRSAIKKTSVPKGEVEAELAKLKARHPEFVELTKEVEELNRRKEQIVAQIADATDTVTRVAVEIQRNLAAIDALNRNILENASEIDFRVALYLEEIERQTKDRLIRYQYLMAKAFEYRILKPAPVDFTLPELIEEFQNIAARGLDGTPWKATPDVFADVKNLFVQELRHIAANIVEDLASNAPERSAPVAFSLQPEELDELNDHGTVTINLFESGLFGFTEENIRIVDLMTREIVVDAEPGVDVTLRIRFEHSGDSLLSFKGKTYSFSHFRNSSVNPITWKTVYDNYDGTLAETHPSAASDSLIRHLLPDLRPGEVLLYSRPSAWADIVITVEARPVHEIVGIERLRLAVNYDYSEKPSDKVELSVQTDGDLAPVITFDQEDLNERRDGRGDFRRVFSKSDTASLRADSVYGNYTFHKWTDERGRDLDPPALDRTLAVNLSEPISLVALYVPSEPAPDPAPDPETQPEPHFVRGDCNDDGEFDISDPVTALGSLFLGKGEPACNDACDTNDDGVVDQSDPITMLGALFLGSPEILTLGIAACGVDPTEDVLTCLRSTSCGE